MMNVAGYFTLTQIQTPIITMYTNMKKVDAHVVTIPCSRGWIRPAAAAMRADVGADTELCVSTSCSIKGVWSVPIRLLAGFPGRKPGLGRKLGVVLRGVA